MTGPASGGPACVLHLPRQPANTNPSGDQLWYVIMLFLTTPITQCSLRLASPYLYSRSSAANPIEMEWKHCAPRKPGLQSGTTMKITGIYFPLLAVILQVRPSRQQRGATPPPPPVAATNMSLTLGCHCWLPLLVALCMCMGVCMCAGLGARHLEATLRTLPLPP